MCSVFNLTPSVLFRSLESMGCERKSVICSQSGQSTIEAAFAIPIVMLLTLLLLQPGIVLYDRIVMKNAASDACRLLASSDGSNDIDDDYVRRRLSAIPQVDIFHVHSEECSYEITLEGNETSDRVSVHIANALKPLPLVDVFMGVGGFTDAGGNMVIDVEESMDCQSEWVSASSSGKSPSEWWQS